MVAVNDSRASATGRTETAARGALDTFCFLEEIPVTAGEGEHHGRGGGVGKERTVFILQKIFVRYSIWASMPEVEAPARSRVDGLEKIGFSVIVMVVRRSDKR